MQAQQVVAHFNIELTNVCPWLFLWRISILSAGAMQQEFALPRAVLAAAAAAAGDGCAVATCSPLIDCAQHKTSIMLATATFEPMSDVVGRNPQLRNEERDQTSRSSAEKQSRQNALGGTLTPPTLNVSTCAAAVLALS